MKWTSFLTKWLPSPSLNISLYLSACLFSSSNSSTPSLHQHVSVQCRCHVYLSWDSDPCCCCICNLFPHIFWMHFVCFCLGRRWVRVCFLIASGFKITSLGFLKLCQHIVDATAVDRCEKIQKPTFSNSQRSIMWLILIWQSSLIEVTKTVPILMYSPFSLLMISAVISCFHCSKKLSSCFGIQPGCQMFSHVKCDFKSAKGPTSLSRFPFHWLMPLS